MEQVRIVKHENPETVYPYYDILFPFEDWKEESLRTGAKWYSKFPEEFYKEKSFLPLYIIHQNSWEALKLLDIVAYEFQEMVSYQCPYNGYVHYWTVPTFIVANSMGDWIYRCAFTERDNFADPDWVQRFHPPRNPHATRNPNSLKFTKVQRALLGSGYSEKTLVNTGKGQIHDAIIALDNGDFLGCKVWVWKNHHK
jgi:hypothetical protein